MNDYEQDDAERDDDEEHYDWYDDDYPEADGSDYEEARSYEEYAEHCDQVHGGAHCDCRPTRLEVALQLARHARNRLRGTWYRAAAFTSGPHTLRAGPVEVTVRLRADRGCGACGGRGWFYTLTSKPEHPVPQGYNGAALCGCGAATAQLAAKRRRLREEGGEPPF